MNKLVLVLPLVLILTPLNLAAQDENTQTASQEMRETQLAEVGEQWLQAYEAQDWAKLRTFYADDAILMPHNSAPTFSADNIVAFLKRLSDAGASVTFQFANEETVIESDDMGFVTAKYRMDIAFPGSEPRVIAGRSLLVYKWQDDGWKLWRDMDNFAPDALPEDFE